MNFRVLFMITITAIAIISCSNENNNEFRTIQQINDEEGIPVRVRKIDHQPFSINYNYNAHLTGIKESTVNAMVGDRIESIKVNVGDYVEKDQLLLKLPQDNPQGQYLQAKAAYNNAKSMYERMKTIYEAGGISGQDLDQVETNYIVSKANYNSAAKSIRVTAPFAGYVTQIPVVETESVHPGDPLVTITVLDRFKSRVWATEEELDDLRSGSHALAKWRGQELIGQVTQVSRTLDPLRQGFIVNLEFNNPGDVMISGLQAGIDIYAYAQDRAIVIERQYIHITCPEQGYVYVLHNDQANRRDVSLGRTDGLRFEIIEGLIAGDMLITEGTNAISDGSTIRVISN